MQCLCGSVRCLGNLSDASPLPALPRKLYGVVGWEGFRTMGDPDGYRSEEEEGKEIVGWNERVALRRIETLENKLCLLRLLAEETEEELALLLQSNPETKT